MMRRIVYLAVAALVSGSLALLLPAADPLPTRITIPGMHCSGCAKQISKQLAQVPGVAKVQHDLKAKTATVTPLPEAVLSPRGLWEALEKIEKPPTRLEGPSGVFTAKPAS